MAAPREFSLEEILPHRAPMLFLDSVRRSGDSSIGAAWKAPASGPWVTDGVLDRAALVEFVAQAAAAHAGLWRRERGLAPEPGYLAGIDGFRFARDVLAGEAVTASVEMRFRLGNVVRASCRVHGADACEIASGELSLVTVPADPVAGPVPPGAPSGAVPAAEASASARAG